MHKKAVKRDNRNTNSKNNDSGTQLESSEREDCEEALSSSIETLRLKRPITAEPQSIKGKRLRVWGLGFRV